MKEHVNDNNKKPMVNLELITSLVRHLDSEKSTDGAILCFLPGWRDIKELFTQLKVIRLICYLICSIGEKNESFQGIR